MPLGWLSTDLDNGRHVDPGRDPIHAVAAHSTPPLRRSTKRVRPLWPGESKCSLCSP